MQLRRIKIKKSDLISKVMENKENHIKEYKQAVIDYLEEAKKQLEEQLKKVADGKTDIELDLTTPVDLTERYDNILEMFKWEVSGEVELNTSEFEEYVLDKDHMVMSAKVSNTFYSKF